MGTKSLTKDASEGAHMRYVIITCNYYQVRTSFSFLNVLLTYFGSCALVTYLIDLDAVVRG